MQFKAWVTIAFAGIAFATSPADIYRRSEQDVASAQDAPALRSLMTQLNPGLSALDTAIKGLTQANAATQMKEIESKARSLAKQMETSAAAVAKSPPLKGMTDALGLMTPGRQALTIVNQTLQDVMAKKDIIKAANQADAFGEILKLFKPGTLALSKAFQTQIPPSMMSQLPAGFTPPTDEQMGQLLDMAFSQAVAWIKGEQTSFSLPADMAGGGIPKMSEGNGQGQPAAPTAAGSLPKGGGTVSAPKPTGAPKAGGIPKQAGTPKLGGPKGNGLYIESWA
jgi:hypothetical protein